MTAGDGLRLARRAMRYMKCRQLRFLSTSCPAALALPACRYASRRTFEATMTPSAAGPAVRASSATIPAPSRRTPATSGSSTASASGPDAADLGVDRLCGASSSSVAEDRPARGVPQCRHRGVGVLGALRAVEPVEHRGHAGVPGAAAVTSYVTMKSLSADTT